MKKVQRRGTKLIPGLLLLISAGVVGELKKNLGFYSISSIGSLSVCGRLAASVFPTVVKYMLKFFAMSLLSVQGIPLDVINVSVTVIFLFLFFNISPIVSHVFTNISMHVKVFFEVIFLCNSDYVG